MTKTELSHQDEFLPPDPPSILRRVVVTLLVLAGCLTALFGLFVVAIVLLVFFGGGLKIGNK